MVNRFDRGQRFFERGRIGHVGGEPAVETLFLIVLVLGWAYMRFGGLPWMQAVFYGVGSAVVGIIVMSAKKLTQKSVGKDKLLWAIYLLLAVVTIATESEIAWLFIAAGILVWFWRAPPRLAGKGGLHAIVAPQLAAGAGLLASADTSLLTQIALFFAKAGAFVFGSGLAIVPFLYGGVVTEHQWLTEKQFVDAVAVAMITPGPVRSSSRSPSSATWWAACPAPAWLRLRPFFRATCSR
jgi:chromate transporter